jgi:hypothetical protein
LLLPRDEVTVKEYVWPCDGVKVKVVFGMSTKVPTFRAVLRVVWETKVFEVKSEI